ncbi:MAG: hypothetical protein NT062_26150 [Proteobacteria bacterium]|nr:hypothetical protein [Pseudomonadota bacterium]
MNWVAIGVLAGAASACNLRGAHEPELTCITPPDEAAAITRASSDDLRRVQYCVGRSAQCVTLDLVSGALTRLAPPPIAAPTNAHVEFTHGTLEICTPAGTCQGLPSKLPLPLHAATTALGKFVVLLAANGHAEVWQVGPGASKRISTFRAARGDLTCGDVAMLGDTIYVSTTDCKMPAARGALYSLLGTKIADVGGKDFGGFGDRHVAISATTWAFLDENGNRIAIQDVVTGKVARTVSIAGLFGDAKDAFGNPGESALVRLDDGRLAVIAGAPASGSVAVVDHAIGDVKITRAPLCSAH